LKDERWWKNLKPCITFAELVKSLARSPAFYFGTVIFFVGLLLFAVGVSKVIGEDFGVLTFAELISGIVMMAVGFRATSRPAQRESQPKP